MNFVILYEILGVSILENKKTNKRTNTAKNKGNVKNNKPTQSKHETTLTKVMYENNLFNIFFD